MRAGSHFINQALKLRVQGRRVALAVRPQRGLDKASPGLRRRYAHSGVRGEEDVGTEQCGRAHVLGYVVVVADQDARAPPVHLKHSVCKPPPTGAAR